MLGLGFSACQKDRESFDTSKQSDLISKVQSEFKSDSASFYRLFDREKYNYRQSLKRIIHWNKSKFKNDTITVPITLQLPKGEINSETGKNTLNHKVFLIASKNSEGGYNFRMLTFIGNSVRLKKFSGVVYNEDYFEGKVQYNSYYNGLSSKTKENNDRVLVQLAAIENRPLTRSMDCNSIKIGRTCVGDPTNDKAPDICSDRYEYQCNWTDHNYVNDIDQWQEDAGDTGGGGGGGDSNPANYDCANVLNGSAYIGDCGICIGGTTGISSCADIINDLKDYPCASNLLSQLPNLNNEIANWLRKTFINSPNDISFRALTTLPNNLDGTWNSNAGNHSLQTITLNGNMLNTASQEYILASMYHEALHGFLAMEEKRLGSVKFSQEYSGFERIPMSSGGAKYVAKHFEFSSQIQKLADAIASFNPSISPYEALALAKAGVIDLNSIESSINSNYKQGKSGTKCK